MMACHHEWDMAPVVFGFEYLPAQGINAYPVPLATGDDEAAAMIELSARMIQNGIACWGLGLLFEHFVSITDQGSYFEMAVTGPGHGSAAATAVLADIRGNVCHTTTFRAEQGRIPKTIYMSAPPDGKRPFVSDDFTMLALWSAARALPQAWRQHSPRARAESN